MSGAVYNSELRSLQACRDKGPELADLAYRLYLERYFDERIAGPDGNPQNKLGVDFPELDPRQGGGQNLRSFQEYWKEFIKGLDAPDPTQRSIGYCYVRQQPGFSGAAIFAFIKGNAAPVSEDDVMVQALRDWSKTSRVDYDAKKTGELGSLYIDRRFQRQGYGQTLTAAYAGTMLDLGYSAMITRCWTGNDSPQFFGRLGASQCGVCDIAIPYYRREKLGSLIVAEVKAQTVIPGVWLLWDRKALETLARKAPKPVAQAPCPSYQLRAG